MEKGTSPTIIFRHLCFASLRPTLSWYQRRPIQPPDHIRAQSVRLFTERRADRSRQRDRLKWSIERSRGAARLVTRSSD
jgi:hypothetical protein